MCIRDRACIVGGLLAANELAGRPCTRDELAQMAAMLEGHPDNSNPGLLYTSRCV